MCRCNNHDSESTAGSGIVSLMILINMSIVLVKDQPDNVAPPPLANYTVKQALNNTLININLDSNNNHIKLVFTY